MRRVIRLKPGEINSHRLANTAQSVLLFAAMSGFLGVLGYLLAGFEGVLWAILLGALSFGISQRYAPMIVLRLYRARCLTPASASALFRLTDALAERAKLDRPIRLYYVPSTILNAFTLSWNGQPIIGVTDGLLRSLDGRELAGVLAHEIGHIRHGDLTVMGLADAISRMTHALSMTGQLLLLVSLPMMWVSDASVPWATILLLMFAPTFNGLLQLALSRTREFDADLEAVKLTGDPEGFISALQKIEYQGAGWFERIFLPGRRIPAPSLLRTHPDTEERIQRIRSLIEVYALPFEFPTLAEWLPVRIERIQRPPGWRWGGLWY